MRMSRRRVGMQPASQSAFSMEYSGEHEAKVITMGNGTRYEQWKLISSGILTARGPERLAHVWLCGGGGGASAGGSYGGGGGFALIQHYFVINGRHEVTIGAGGLSGVDTADATDGGDTRLATLIARGGTCGTILGGGDGGSGGGRARGLSVGGTGDKMKKFPFGDMTNFWPDAFCAGGGGGGYAEEGQGAVQYAGWHGGTNGGDCAAPGTLGGMEGGEGGVCGGGHGSSWNAASDMRDATFYGSGGGGGGGLLRDGVLTMTPGGKGHAGIVFVRLLP